MQYDASWLRPGMLHMTRGEHVWYLWCSSVLTRLRQPQPPCSGTSATSPRDHLLFHLRGRSSEAVGAPTYASRATRPCQKTSRPFLCGLAMRQRGGAGEMKRRGKKGESNTNLGEYEREERARAIS